MFVVISIISAIIAGMGIGGGTIFVLLSTNFLDVGQKEAQLLNLVLFMAVSFSSTIANFKNKNIDLKIIKKVIPLLVLGAVIGTRLFYKLNNQNLRKYFLYFLVIIGIYEIISSVINLKKEKNNTKEYRKE